MLFIFRRATYFTPAANASRAFGHHHLGHNNHLEEVRLSYLAHSTKYLSIFAFRSSLPSGLFVELLTGIRKIEMRFPHKSVKLRFPPARNGNGNGQLGYTSLLFSASRLNFSNYATR